MKRLLLLAVVILTACEKKEKTSIQTDRELEAEVNRIADSALQAAEYETSVPPTNENPKVIEAKQIIDESSEWMEKGIKKEISVEESNKMINPLMEKFEKINSTLSPSDQEYLKNYRIERAQKSIDLQIQYSK